MCFPALFVHAKHTTRVHDAEKKEFRNKFKAAEKLVYCRQCHAQLNVDGKRDYVAAHVVTYPCFPLNMCCGRLLLKQTCSKCNYTKNAESSCVKCSCFTPCCACPGPCDCRKKEENVPRSGVVQSNFSEAPWCSSKDCWHTAFGQYWDCCLCCLVWKRCWFGCCYCNDMSVGGCVVQPFCCQMSFKDEQPRAAAEPKM